MSSNYDIGVNDSSVTAWSTACIPYPPYKPQDWRVDFRDDLREAIAGLPSQQGKVLSAAYRSPIREGADLSADRDAMEDKELRELGGIDATGQ